MNSSHEDMMLKDKAVINISEINGRIIKQFTISDIQGPILWDLRETIAGIYYYQVTDATSLLAKGKNVIEK